MAALAIPAPEKIEPQFLKEAMNLQNDYCANSTADGMRPWEQPFWKPARGKVGVLLYLVLIHILAVIGFVLFPLPNLRILCLSALAAAIGGLATTICYHRVLAHRTLKINKVVEQVLIFFCVFNGSGHPASWVAYHRRHHSTTDTPDDVSSPVHGGFWWAHLRWLYQSAPADPQRWCPELNRGTYRLWAYAEAVVIPLSLCCGFLIGLRWQGFFWLGAIRLLYSLHMQCFVNSLMHLGNSKQGDCSKNVWWLGPLQLGAWGENWHRNHHSHAGSARLGLRWWQPDIGWYFIYIMESIGLAQNVKRPRLQ